MENKYLKQFKNAIGTIVILLSFAANVHAQVNINEDFTVDEGEFDDIDFTQTVSWQSCNDGALYANLYYDPDGWGVEYATTESAMHVTAGGAVLVNVEYQIIDYYTESHVDYNFGVVNFDYSIDGGSTWTTFYSVTEANYNPTAPGCISFSQTLSGIPSGSNFVIRIAAEVEEEDWIISIENFTASEITLSPSPTITQSATTPDCTSGTSLSVTGTPVVGDAWYWQTTATGTSTANVATTPWTVMVNGTYYARTYNTANNVWSDASSITVSNIPTAPAPPTPVANQNPACAPGTDITVPAATGSLVYYWQGTSNTTSSTANNATTPYNVTGTGTYYVRAFDSATNCWSTSAGVTVTVTSLVPSVPSVTTSEYFVCDGVASLEISASQSTTGTIVVPIASNYTLGAYAYQTINGTIAGIPAGATVTSSVVTFDGVTTTLDTYLSDIDVRITGATVLPWTLLTGPNSTVTNYGPINLNTTGATNGNFTMNLDHLYLFGGPATFASIYLTINYSMPTTVNWYDASVAGNHVGSGSPFETIGTSVIPTATSGSYEFFAESVIGGCVSPTRTLVTVNIDPVNVVLTTIDATCNNGNDGTFGLASSTCGQAPFSYSVNDGAFGSIPSNLTPGTYTVIVRDANNEESGEYTIVIGAADGPSDVTVDAYTDEEITFSWTVNGTDTQWNIEWGPSGFTPGTGTEIGSATATTNPYTITGLDAATEYDIYVSTNCSSTLGDWSLVTATTECAPISAPWCDNFESGSLDCWTTIDGDNDGYVSGGLEYAQWTVWNSNFDPLFEGHSLSGDHFAAHYTALAATAMNDFMVTPRIELTGNEVLSFNYRLIINPGTVNLKVLLSTTGKNPSDFTEVLMANTPLSNMTYEDTTINLSAYSTPVYIAFVRSGATGTQLGLAIDDVCIDICNPIAGTDGAEDVCRTAGTVDLNTVITNQYTHGTWQFPANQSVISGSTMNVSTLANGTYDIYYVVDGACSSDTTVASITVVNPSSAGTNGVLTVCKSQFIDLYGGLNGNADYGGTWYTPNGTAMTSSYFQTGTLPGQFVYKYIVSNGVCGPDTSEVTVDIQNCVGLEDISLLENVTIAPNPNTGNFQIIGVAGADYTFEVLDVNGRVIRQSIKITSTITDVNLTDVENGVYMVRIFGNNAERMMRVIKH